MARTHKNSRDYWREREIEHAKNIFQDENDIKRRMKGLYNHTAREIEKEINTMLSNYASKNGLSMSDVMKEVTETDIRDYESKAKRYVKEKNFSDRANREMAIYNLRMRVSRLEMIRRHIDLELIALTDGMDKLIYDRILEVGMNELKRQSGILGENFRMDKSGVEYIAKRQFHNDDFSNRLWKNKHRLHQELDNRLAELIQKGDNPKVLARKMRKEIEQSVFASERIMITEGARVQSEVQIESFKESGYSQYVFIATEGQCDVCGKLDDQVFNVSDATPGENMPPLHPFCKCSTAAYMDREAFEANLAERGL